MLNINRAYPTHVLPMMIQDFIHQVCCATKASEGLVASTTIVTMAAAAQGLINVKSANGFPMPISLNTIVAVPSGDRKSSVLKHVTYAFNKFEEEHLATGHVHPLILEETTEQGLADIFEQGAKAVFFALPEGHQMLRSLEFAAFCKRFDGDTIRKTTRTHGTQIIANTRSSVCLLIQDSVFQRYISQKGESMLESGFFGRILLSFPNNSQADNVVQQVALLPEVHGQDLLHHPFHDRVHELLNDYADSLQHDNYDRLLLELDDEAKPYWNNFYQQTEQSSSSSNLNESQAKIVSFVKRAGELALRLAAVIQWFHQPKTKISLQNTMAACNIVAWHLEEARINLSPPPITVQVAQWAETLYNYLYRQYQAIGVVEPLTKSELLRRVPSSIRKADHLHAAICFLARDNRIIYRKEGRKEIVHLNFNPFNYAPSGPQTPSLFG